MNTQEGMNLTLRRLELNHLDDSPNGPDSSSPSPPAFLLQLVLLSPYYSQSPTPPNATLSLSVTLSMVFPGAPSMPHGWDSARYNPVNN